MVALTYVFDLCVGRDGIEFKEDDVNDRHLVLRRLAAGAELRAYNECPCFGSMSPSGFVQSVSLEAIDADDVLGRRKLFSTSAVTGVDATSV